MWSTLETEHLKNLSPSFRPRLLSVWELKVCGVMAETYAITNIS